MDPISLTIMGVLALGSSAFSYIKQQQANDQAKVAADLAVEQAKADAAVKRAQQDYGVVAAELAVEAEQLQAQRRVAKLAAQRARLEKSVLLAIAALCVLGAMIMLVRNRQRTNAGPTHSAPNR